MRHYVLEYATQDTSAAKQAYNGKTEMRRFRKYNLAIAATVLAMSSGVAFAEDALRDDSIGGLRDEGKIPFRFQGLGLDNVSVARNYGASVGRFSSIEACLTGGLSPTSASDLNEFNWSRFSSPREADVCIFRVAASLSEPDLFIAWLETQGFSIQRKYSTSDTRSDAQWIGIDASRREKNQPPPFFSGLFHALIGRNDGYFIYAKFNMSGEPVHIRSGFMVK